MVTPAGHENSPLGEPEPGAHPAPRGLTSAPHEAWGRPLPGLCGACGRRAAGSGQRSQPKPSLLSRGKRSAAKGKPPPARRRGLKQARPDRNATNKKKSTTIQTQPCRRAPVLPEGAPPPPAPPLPVTPPPRFPRPRSPTAPLAGRAAGPRALRFSGCAAGGGCARRGTPRGPRFPPSGKGEARRGGRPRRQETAKARAPAGTASPFCRCARWVTRGRQDRSPGWLPPVSHKVENPIALPWEIVTLTNTPACGGQRYGLSTELSGRNGAT
ncbi:E3 ubiquitin-protein ligase TRIM13 isoform X4 [Manis javanica]|uniref:E3 ubiquitin-protein ligase TRIM13 isoform X4 n=1 Tax=Manis javanica TaxID=9974 RepID=UPI003C6CE7EE